MPRGMWSLHRPGTELMCPALAGRFLATGPPGKPPHLCLSIRFWLSKQHAGKTNIISQEDEIT